MFRMNNDFFDYFDVSFTKKESILKGKSYPLGYFATEVLEMDCSLLRKISAQVETFKHEFNVFLTANSATSAALANEALTTLWALFSQLPVYDKVSPHDSRIKFLINHMKAHPDEVMDMTTPGTERNQMLNLWLYNIEHLVSSVDHFIRNTEFMLENYFENLPSRKPESYVMAYSKYKHDIIDGYDIADQEDEDTSELDSHKLHFPFSLTFESQRHPQTQEVFLAEVVTFGTLESFLYTDLMKAMAAGNVPRKCHNCKKYFLAVGGYDTVYCQRIAPGETEKTCRKVGAHKKEKAKNGSSFIQIEYQRAYNRLKSRRTRGTLPTDEWNRQVAFIENLEAKIKNGELTDAEYLVELDKV